MCTLTNWSANEQRAMQKQWMYGLLFLTTFKNQGDCIQFVNTGNSLCSNLADEAQNRSRERKLAASYCLRLGIGRW
jgi:hypothetical protein